MSTTVQTAGFTVTGSAPSADVIASLTPSDPDAEQPKVIVKDGQPVTEEDTAKEKLSEAASELGKKGAEAAAAKRSEKEKQEAAAKEAKPEEKPEPEDDLKGRARERVERATREAAALKRELAAARQREQEFHKRLEEIEKRSAPTPKVDEDAEPKASDFEDYGEYVEKRARWGARQELKAREQEHSAKSVIDESDRAFDSTVQRYNERMRKAAESDATLLQELQPIMEYLVPSYQVAPDKYGPVHAITDEILISDIPDKLLRHFARNKEDFQRIASLRTPQNILREMAKLEAKLGSATSGTPPPVGDPPSKVEISKAPSPVRPVTGKPVIAPGAFVEGMNFDEWLARQPKR